MIPGDQDTPDSTAHNGSRASTPGPPRYLRVERIAPPNLVAHLFPGTRVALGWGTKPALPFGIHVAGDSTFAPVFRRSCPPVIMAYVLEDARIFVDVFAGSFA